MAPPSPESSSTTNSSESTRDLKEISLSRSEDDDLEGQVHSAAAGEEFTSDLDKKLNDSFGNGNFLCCLVPKKLIGEFVSVYKYHSADYFGLREFLKSRQTVTTVLNASLYTWSFSFLTTASFGYLFSVDTDGTWGPAQSFLSGGLTGLFMSLVGGQPLVLYGQTGPIVLLYVYCYEVSGRLFPFPSPTNPKLFNSTFSRRFRLAPSYLSLSLFVSPSHSFARFRLLQFAHEQSIPFEGFVGWIGVWSALQHFAISLASLNDTKYLDYITRFTGEIFELLVAADYITAAIIGFYYAYTDKGCKISACSEPTVRYLNGTFTLLLGLVFWSFALKLQGSNKPGGMKWGTYTFRRAFSQFGCIIALFCITVLSYAPEWNNTNGWPYTGVPARVDISPSRWGNPKLNFTLAVSQMGQMTGGQILAALIPALLLTVLFYVDQNLSTLMAVRNVGELKSKPAFNMDFFLLGVTVLVTGLMGLPASSGLIPQNPMHSKALIVSPEDSSRPPYVVEQRISNIIHSGLLLIFILFLPIVSFIPTGVLWGAFLLLAVEAYGAQFVQCCLLYFTSKKSKKLPAWEDFRDIIDGVPADVVNIFTAFQFVLWAVIFVVAVILKIPFPMNDGNTWVIIGSLFPVMIVLCAVLRFTVVPKFIEERHLALLDPHDVNVKRKKRHKRAARGSAAVDDGDNIPSVDSDCS